VTRTLNCDDCGVSTYGEYYMVQDAIWQRYGSDWMLCIGCLEKRMGRQLVTRDFTAANFTSMNDGRFRSYRLIDRLTSDGTFVTSP